MVILLQKKKYNRSIERGEVIKIETYIPYLTVQITISTANWRKNKSSSCNGSSSKRKMKN